MKNEDSTFKEVSRSLRLKFYHFVTPILSMGNLHKVVVSGATTLEPSFGGLTITPNPQSQKRKIDLCVCHRPKYFARLVPEIGLFSKVCNRS